MQDVFIGAGLPMKVVVQRVDSAAVRCDGQTIASIARGVVLYVGISRDEPPGGCEWLVEELRRIRAPGDHVLCLSQFTLFGVFRGPGPSFHRAERAELAAPYFAELVRAVGVAFGCRVESGLFGRALHVELSGGAMETHLLERPAEARR